MTKPKEKDGVTKYHVNRRVGFNTSRFFHIFNGYVIACSIGSAIVGQFHRSPDTAQHWSSSELRRRARSLAG